MKKIGILTFHSAINNGAVLQAYALVQAIESYGVKCEDIDYTAKAIIHSYDIQPIKNRRSLKAIALYFVKDRAVLETQKKFSEFRSKYLKISVSCYDDCIKLASGRYDALIVGSDQVWNGDLTGNDENYYLAFDSTTPKFSYGASFGKEKINTWDISAINKYLTTFKKVTVREDCAKTLLKNAVGIESTVVPDPVYLLSKKEWEKNFKLKERNEKYILFFMLHYNDQMIEFCNNLSKETGLKVYNLTNSFLKSKGMKKIKKYGPEDFLQYIYGATYVVTDSFHAISISLIFNKELYIGLKSGKLSSLNTRIESLVKRYDIANRIIGEDVSFKRMSYKKINKNLEKQREFGLLYIKEIVEWEKNE